MKRFSLSIILLFLAYLVAMDGLVPGVAAIFVLVVAFRTGSLLATLLAGITGGLFSAWLLSRLPENLADLKRAWAELWDQDLDDPGF